MTLEGSSAAEILAWASEQHGGKLTFATGFGAEGCVLIDLIARTCRSICSRSIPACCSPRPTRCGTGSKTAGGGDDLRGAP